RGHNGTGNEDDSFADEGRRVWRDKATLPLIDVFPDQREKRHEEPDDRPSADPELRVRRVEEPVEYHLISGNQQSQKHPERYRSPVSSARRELRLLSRCFTCKAHGFASGFIEVRRSRMIGSGSLHLRPTASGPDAWSLACSSNRSVAVQSQGLSMPLRVVAVVTQRCGEPLMGRGDERRTLRLEAEPG